MGVKEVNIQRDKVKKKEYDLEESNKRCKRLEEQLKDVIAQTAKATAEQVRKSVEKEFLLKINEERAEKEELKETIKIQETYVKKWKTTDEDRRKNDEDWLKEMRRVMDDNRKLRKQVEELYLENGDLEEYIMQMGSDATDDEVQGRGRRTTKRQKQKSAERRRQKHRKQRQWQRTCVSKADRLCQQQGMREIQRDVMFDQLISGLVHPDFAEAMSTMLQDMSTDGAMDAVPATDSSEEEEAEESFDVFGSSESDTVGESLLPWYAKTR